MQQCKLKLGLADLEYAVRKVVRSLRFEKSSKNEGLKFSKFVGTIDARPIVSCRLKEFLQSWVTVGRVVGRD